jgi:hypothetical protein
MLREQAEAVGVENPFYTFYNAPHVPYLGTSASALSYMDTTVNFVRDFLIDQLGCTDAPLQTENAYVQTSTLYTVSACTVNVPFNDCTALDVEEFNGTEDLKIYPNPANSNVTIEVLNDEFQSVQITDMNGRKVYDIQITGSFTNVDCSAMKPGIYFVIATNNNNQSRTIKLVIK